MNRHLKIILKKMFQMVGEDFSEEYMNQDMWFHNHVWTKEQEDSFLQWMENYLFENNEARNVLMEVPRKERSIIRYACNSFILDYGWRLDDYPEIEPFVQTFAPPVWPIIRERLHPILDRCFIRKEEISKNTPILMNQSRRDILLVEEERVKEVLSMCCDRFEAYESALKELGIHDEETAGSEGEEEA